jgi:hypothetical protein
MQYLEHVFSAIGTLTPFYLAGAVYWFFSWLDSNASAAAILAVSAWLKNNPYRQVDLRDAFRRVFDQIYTESLLSRRGFARSLVISSSIWLLVLLFGALRNIIHLGNDYERFAVKAYFLTNISLLPQMILSDYISLFVVRRVLDVSGRRPILTLTLALLTGIFAVFVLAMLSVFAAQTLISEFLDYEVDTQALEELMLPGPVLWFIIILGVAIPAMIVHLWIVLLVVGVLGFRFLHLIFKGIGYAQWFLKKGARHPFKAIGIVAAFVIFLFGLSMKLLLILLDRSGTVA